jgi:hypothetical protein
MAGASSVLGKGAPILSKSLTDYSKANENTFLGGVSGFAGGMVGDIALGPKDAEGNRSGGLAGDFRTAASSGIVDANKAALNRNTGGA